MAWAVRISRRGGMGTGVVLAPRLVVTCAHVLGKAETAVVRTEGGGDLSVRVVASDAEVDVALLEPVDREAVFPPASVVIPRSYTRGRRLQGGQALVALCTDDAETPRSLDVEIRPTPRDAHWIEFVVRSNREGVRRGYSGGPVVEIDEHTGAPRLLGIVRSRDESSVIDLDAARGWFVPTDRIADRLVQVGERLESPVERGSDWDRHWEPRSRGVASRLNAGFFYTGHIEAYDRVRLHLGEGSGLLVVTGPRGSGKSALLAHVVTLGCRRYLTLLGDDKTQAVDGYAPPDRPVDAAVLARGKSAAAISNEIGEQLGLGEISASDLVSVLTRESLRPSIVIDAVDESTEQAALLREVITPLAQAEARLVIGALRRRIATHVLDASWVDLERAPYRDDHAIPEFVRRRLTARGQYTESVARAVASAIADRANGIFLIAELVARTLADSEPLDTLTPNWRERLPRDVTQAFNDYLSRFDEPDRMLALLHPLAYAYGDGLTVEPPEVWLGVANRLRPQDLAPFTDADLRDAHAKASDYLVTSAEDGAAHLYHEGLADAVRVLAARERLMRTGRDPTPEATEREQASISQSVTQTLVDLLPDPDAGADAYTASDPYLLNHLPAHLAEHERTAELLDRPGFLLIADQESLRCALTLGALTVPPEKGAMRVAVVHALAWDRRSATDRAAALCAALQRQRQDRLAHDLRRALTPSGETPRRTPQLPYSLVTGPPLPAVLATIGAAHDDRIIGLVVTEWEGAPLLLSTGSDAAIRSWRLDGSPGPFAVEGAHRTVKALAVTQVDGAPLVTSAGSDPAIRSWRLDGSPGPFATEDGDRTVEALAVAQWDSAPLLISAGSGGIRSWRLDGSDGPFAVEYARSGHVTLFALTECDGAPLLISVDYDRAIRSWRLDGTLGPLAVEDVESDAAVEPLSAYWSESLGRPHVAVGALVAWQGDGAPLLMSGSENGAIRSWRMDGSRGPLAVEDAHRRGIQALLVANEDDAPLLISGGSDGAIRSWRMDGSRDLFAVEDAHGGGVTALADAGLNGTPLLISGGSDGAIRSWRLDGNREPSAGEDAHDGGVTALAGVEWGCAPLLISGMASGAIRSWRVDGSRGPLSVEDAHSKQVTKFVVAEWEGAPLLVSAGWDGAIHSWRLDGSRGPFKALAHLNGVERLVVAEWEGAPLLISAGADLAITSRRLDGSPGPINIRRAHRGGLNAFVVVEWDGAPLLISADREDWVIRSWRLDGSPGPSDVGDGLGTVGHFNALTVVDQEGAPLLIGACSDRAIRSWRVDGSRGPLAVEDAHTGQVTTLVVAQWEGSPLLIGADWDGAIRSWRFDGSRGPLAVDDAHTRGIADVVIVHEHGTPVLVSADWGGVILAHTGAQ